MVKEDGGGGNGTGLKPVSSTSSINLDERTTQNFAGLKKTAGNAGSGYIIKTYNLPQTNPQIIDTLVQIADLQGDTTINIYMRQVPKMRNLDGTLTDFEGNPMHGYVIAYDTLGDTSFAMTDTTGQFSLKVNPTSGDTLVGQIINPNHNEAFLRTIYVPGANDSAGINVDAIPLLADSAYMLPPGTLCWEVVAKCDSLRKVSRTLWLPGFNQESTFETLSFLSSARHIP